MTMPSRTRSSSSLSRRAFVTGAGALGGALAWPRGVSAQQENPGPPVGPNDIVTLAVVGIGDRGLDNIKDVKDTGVKIVALCDVDDRQAAEAWKMLPDAKRYKDWRRMLDAEKTVDAVLVATPDHNHAIVSIAAMRRGKHVYCEKPLAHSIWEARMMARVASEMNVATQMGTQGHAYEGTRPAVEAIRAGAIGEVTELHVWTDRPAGWWPQGVARPAEAQPVPPELDWDVWLGPAPERPYNEAYVPFKWRGFWDFGTGAIGDMGIHNLDTAYWALGLGTPTRATVRECSPGLMDATIKETAPLWSIIDIEFPARGAKPPVKMTWYDGGKLPPTELFQGEKLVTHDGGSLVIGTKGTLFTRTWHGGDSAANMFLLLPQKTFADFAPPEQMLPRTPGHHREWVDACRGQAMPLSNFAYASVLTEALLVGNLALRTGGTVEWNAAAMTTGSQPADAFVKPAFRNGWSFD
jgi:predicted dehydrogenase